ncbi:ABC transporter substrate-binding protein [Brevibacillus sp. SYP-B805]|uniref:ABC transporter substrate-binding protein n=1 Tax=Brevibacillus sp. SYP-B805 TaxID=1578199 RepID=UPI0013ECDFC4|nr:ABC transporter substrate-binding protein [Brevibacillus sp. SYP-B805]NGQ96126.1 ABC transporter substrate-binding protein [Brevibacillus sp. SYP-B805]
MRRVRMLFAVLMVFLLAISMAACSGSTQPGTGGSAQATGNSSSQGTNGEKPKSYKIGVNLELTGVASVWGVPQKNAVEMLVEQINQKGGINGVPIELVVYDNESSETQSLVVTKKLVEEDQVLAVIGGGTTPTTMPLVPYMNQQKVTLVSVGSGDEIVEPAKDRPYIFKTPSNNDDISHSIASFLKEKGKTNVAFMSMNNAYGESGKKSFEKVAKDYGINIVANEKFGAGDKDMKPQLTKIKSKNPDAVIVWAIPPSASIVNRNFWELKMDQMLIYSAGAGSNAFMQLAGAKAAEGTYIASGKVWIADQLPDSDPQKQLLTKYVKDFESKFFTGVSPIDGMAYDTMLLLAKAMEMAGDQVNRETIRENMEKIQNLVGTTGIFNLSPDDHQGLKPEDIIILQVKDGRWVKAE